MVTGTRAGKRKLSQELNEIPVETTKRGKLPTQTKTGQLPGGSRWLPGMPKVNKISIGKNKVAVAKKQTIKPSSGYSDDNNNAQICNPKEPQPETSTQKKGNVSSRAKMAIARPEVDQVTVGVRDSEDKFMDEADTEEVSFNQGSDSEDEFEQGCDSDSFGSVKIKPASAEELRKTQEEELHVLSENPYFQGLVSNMFKTRVEAALKDANAKTPSKSDRNLDDDPEQADVAVGVRNEVIQPEQNAEATWKEQACEVANKQITDAEQMKA